MFLVLVQAASQATQIATAMTRTVTLTADVISPATTTVVVTMIVVAVIVITVMITIAMKDQVTITEVAVQGTAVQICHYGVNSCRSAFLLECRAHLSYLQKKLKEI